jgi:hypothetical protein
MTVMGCHVARLFQVTFAGGSCGVGLTALFVLGDHPRETESVRNVGAAGTRPPAGHGARHRLEPRAYALAVPAHGRLQT